MLFSIKVHLLIRKCYFQESLQRFVTNTYHMYIIYFILSDFNLFFVFAYCTCIFVYSIQLIIFWLILIQILSYSSYSYILFLIFYIMIYILY